MSENKPVTGENLTETPEASIGEMYRNQSIGGFPPQPRHDGGGWSDQSANDNKQARATLALLLEVPLAGSGGQPVTFGNVSQMAAHADDIRCWLEGFLTP